MPKRRQITRLELVRGSSAKQYTVWLMPKARGFEVWAAWGRIADKTPSTARKTQKALPRAEAELVAQKLLDAKRRKGYSERGGKTHVSQQRKDARGNPWLDRLSDFRARKALATLVIRALRLPGLVLDPKLEPKAVASTLIGYAPHARAFFPKSLSVDERCVRVSTRALRAAVKLEAPLRPKDDPGPIAAAMLVALASRGVKSIDYLYAGGWDEVSMVEDDPTIEFLVAPPGGKAGMRKATAQLATWLAKQHAEFRWSNLLFSLLEDSGAGPPEYSQNFRIDLAAGRTRLYGWERSTYE